MIIFERKIPDFIWQNEQKSKNEKNICIKKIKDNSHNKFLYLRYRIQVFLFHEHLHNLKFFQQPASLLIFPKKYIIKYPKMKNSFPLMFKFMAGSLF